MLASKYHVTDTFFLNEGLWCITKVEQDECYFGTELDTLTSYFAEEVESGDTAWFSEETVTKGVINGRM